MIGYTPVDDGHYVMRLDMLVLFAPAVITDPSWAKRPCTANECRT
jgi:hypothetical protein